MEKDDLVILQRTITELRSEAKYKEAIENCYILIERAKQLNDNKSLLAAYIDLVASYYYVGDIEAAFNYVEIHKEICDKYGDEEDILLSSNVLCLIYETKDLNKVKNTLEKSIQLGKKLKKYNVVTIAYSNYSKILINEGDYIHALEMATIGLKITKLYKPGYPILELRVKLNISEALIGLKDFKASKALIQEIINDPILDSHIREKARCYNLLAHWYGKQQLYNEAFKSFSYAKTLAENYKDFYFLKDIQEERCKLCELMGDINLGYKVQKEYISLLNEIRKSELELLALKLQTKYSIASMKKEANTDYLTGIYNRNYIETSVNGILKQSHKKNESIICMVFDLDGFKAINDDYGHLFGDDVIKQVSVACSSILRESDLFARFGGDEFVIIIKGISLENGVNKAEQILETVRNLKIYNGEKLIPITISIGIADNLTCAAMNFNDLFNAADLRLYKAKNSGRNQVCAVYKEL